MISSTAKAVSPYSPGVQRHADAFRTDSAATTAPLSGSASILRNVSMTSKLDLKMTAPLPFEDYWCSSIATVTARDAVWYLYGASNKPELYGLASSAKSSCMSLEREDYSKWATKHPISTTLPTHSLVTLDMWTPTHIPPCCNTFCNFLIPSAELYYWPTPAPVAMRDRTTAVGPDGFT